MTSDNRRLDVLLLAALLSFVVLPWYHIRSGFFGFGWLPDWTGDADLWPGLAQLAVRWWLWPVAALIVAALVARLAWPPGRRRGGILPVIGAAGLIWLLTEGLSVGLHGWNWSLWETLFGEVAG